MKSMSDEVEALATAPDTAVTDEGPAVDASLEAGLAAQDEQPSSGDATVEEGADVAVEVDEPVAALAEEPVEQNTMWVGLVSP